MIKARQVLFSWITVSQRASLAFVWLLFTSQPCQKQALCFGVPVSFVTSCHIRPQALFLSDIVVQHITLNGIKWSSPLEVDCYLQYLLHEDCTYKVLFKYLVHVAFYWSLIFFFLLYSLLGIFWKAARIGIKNSCFISDISCSRIFSSMNVWDLTKVCKCFRKLETLYGNGYDIDNSSFG